MSGGAISAMGMISGWSYTSFCMNASRWSPLWSEVPSETCRSAEGQPPEAIITGAACDETEPINLFPPGPVSRDCVPVLKLLDGR